MTLISKENLIAEYDRVHVGPPGGARKLMEDAEPVEAIPLEWIESYIKTCEIFDLRANGIPAEKIIKTMIKIWAQETQGKKRGGDNGKT